MALRYRCRHRLDVLGRPSAANGTRAKIQGRKGSLCCRLLARRQCSRHLVARGLRLGWRKLVSDHARQMCYRGLLRYRDEGGDDWANIIDMLTMHPDARRQVARLLGEIDAKGR